MHPVLFTFRGFEFRSYGALMAVAILTGILLGEAEARRKKLPPGTMTGFAPAAVLAGIFFSRMAFVMTEAGHFMEHPLQILNLRGGGLNFYGGLAGGTAAALFYVRVKKIPFPEFADSAAPGISAGLVAGRIGCFLNGCCHGIPSDLPWAVAYSSPRSSAVLCVPVHPSQLYEASGSLLLFFILWFIRKRNFPRGSFFLFFTLLYSVLRLFLEGFRADTLPPVPVVSRFTWTEVFFLVIIIVSALMILVNNRRRPRGRSGTQGG